MFFKHSLSMLTLPLCTPSSLSLSFLPYPTPLLPGRLFLSCPVLSHAIHPFTLSFFTPWDSGVGASGLASSQGNGTLPYPPLLPSLSRLLLSLWPSPSDSFHASLVILLLLLLLPAWNHEHYSLFTNELASIR
ncbi:hypothetical protein GGR55DRAFT_664093, partial [Xylaria sp. FL0064]